MAVRESVSPHGAGKRRTWFVAACLIVLFVAALFLRAYWNLDVANPTEGEYLLSGDGDPYYHKRAIDAIQANGFRHHLGDPLLNYPGGAENPNPPLYEWSVAVSGQLLAPFTDPVTMADGTTLSALEVATWNAAIWSPAIFGALTVFTVYAIAAALFDRRAGLVAALLWTVSTQAIDSAGVGHADHDPLVILFVTLALAFYIQALRHFRGDSNWVTKWSDGASVSKGLSALLRERRAGFGYAVLAAISIAGVALTWKGFNYVLGIIFIYAVVQMIVDHWRSRDSTGMFTATFVALAGGVLIALPYYTTAAVGNFLEPTWYILAALLVAGLVLVPTRDLPTILVLPIATVAGIILAVAAFVVFPTVSQSLLYATVYFKQTRLYLTIGEARGADFSSIAFGIGPVGFFLALAGWAYLAFTFRRHATRPVLFALIWGVVALFMAQSAARFLINAIPVFCVFAGYMAIWVLDWLDFGAIRKATAANAGNLWQGIRRGTRPMHIIAVVLIALLFVFPTTMLAADAALPPEAENRIAGDSDSEFVQKFFTQRMGAYGQGFGGVRPWVGPFEFLDAHDVNITDPGARPGFVSWWDYGHWATAIGRHPSVADPFQNGYEIAANFILAQDEAQSIQILAARLADAPGADLVAAARAAGSADPAADAAKIAKWVKVDLTVEQSATLLATVEAQTGKSIRYFAADIRMLPFDNPQTPSIESGSIYYAPVTLKGDEPNDYVTTQVSTGGQYMTVEEYKELARDPIRQHEVTGERYAFQDKFFNSAFYRHYVGTPVDTSGEGALTGTELQSALGSPLPGYGLEHFRVIYVGGIDRIYRGGDGTSPSSFIYYPGVIMTEYYRGAIVEGTVTEEGTPLAGVTVTALDDTGRLFAEAFQGAIDDASAFNVPHQQVVTGADGKFRLVAPFALEGGNVTIRATRGDAILGSAAVAITRADAEAQTLFSDVSISVQRGSVEGIAFRDLDSNGVYDAANETVLGNASITIGDKTVTSGADGKFVVPGVAAGTQNVTTDSTTLQVVSASSRVRVSPGATTTRDVGFEPRAARVAGTLLRDDGNASHGVPFSTLTFTADANVTDNSARTVSGIFSGSDGNYTATLQPGTYVVTASYAPPGSAERYTLSETLVLTAGQTLNDRDFHMAKQSST